MKNENRYIVTQNDRQINLRKFFVVLVGLIMILSGLLVSTMPIGAGGFVPSVHESREFGNNTTNNYDPVVEADTRQMDYKYPNDGSVKVRLIVNVTDEDNDTTHGAAIASVTYASTALGILGSLSYNQSGSSILLYNHTDRTGIWNTIVAITIPVKPAGTYNITVTVTDNGTKPGVKTNTTNITIRLYQVNRAPRVRTSLEGGEFSYSTYEDDWWGIDFWINETVFIDNDVEGQPYPFTETDKLTFTLWNSDEDEWMTYYLAENYSCGFNMFDMNMFLIFAEVENAYTLDAGEIVLLNATDSHGKSIEKEITIKITPVNDLPELKGMDSHDDNANISDDGFTITTTQGQFVNLTVNASDVDITDTLTFAVESFKPNTTTGLSAEPFTPDTTTGNLKFIPENDAVGSFIVNISVSDSTETVEANFTFEVVNANDPPIIEKVDGSPMPADKLHDLSATPLTTNAPNASFTLIASDIDFNIPDGEVLTWAQNVATLDTSTYVIAPDATNDNKTADITIVGENLVDGIHTFNFTVSDDGGLSDYVLVKVNRSFAPPPPTNVAPTLTLATGATTLKIGEILTISGTVSDDTIPEGGALKVMIKIASGDDVLLAETTVTPSAGGYTYDFEIPAKDAAGNSSVGTWTITVWVTDGELDSDQLTTTYSVRKAPPVGDGEKEDLTLLITGIGIIIVIIIVVLILLFLFVFRKKPAEREEPHEEGVKEIPEKEQPLPGKKQPKIKSDPLDILKQRLAKGEIDLETYKALKKELE